jgi:transposase
MARGRKRLTDKQWEALKDLLPLPKRRRRPQADDWRTINGILCVLQTGCS